MAPYQSLKAWQHAQRLAIECARAAKAFPEYEQDALADQLRRACYTVVLNIAEGSAKRGSREYRRYRYSEWITRRSRDGFRYRARAGVRSASRVRATRSARDRDWENTVRSTEENHCQRHALTSSLAPTTR